MQWSLRCRRTGSVVHASESPKRTRERRFLVAGAALAGLLSFACVAVGATNAKPVLTIGVNFTDPVNPLKGQGIHFGRSLSTQTLIAVKPNSSGTAAYVYVSGIAASWRYVGKGNTTFELTLRPGLRFSDGTAVTPQAVAAWIKFYLANNGPFASSLGAVDSYQASGRTLRLRLKAPNPTIPYAFSLPGGVGAVQSPKCATSSSSLDSQTCGAGPYMLSPAQTVAGDHYTFVPNPYFSDKSQIRFSKVVIKVIATNSSMLQALQAGQLQIAQGDPTTAKAAHGSGFGVLSVPNSGYTATFTLDVGGTKSQPLADVRVRQALNYAIDRKAIAKAVAGRYGVATDQYPTLDGYNPKYANYYAYNPTKAKALLAAAGYGKGFTIDNVLVNGYVGAVGPTLSQAVAKYLGDVGVNLNLNIAATPNAYIPALLSNPSAMMEVAGPPLTLWATYSLVVAPGSLANRIGPGWSDSTLAAMYQKASQAQNSGPLFQAISARLVTRAYYLPVVVTSSLFYTAKNITGLSGPLIDATIENASMK